jgi:hypothetical protein
MQDEMKAQIKRNVPEFTEEPLQCPACPDVIKGK